MAQERRTVTVEEAAEILGISRGSAYSLAKSGSLPVVRLGKRLLVPKAALDRLLGETSNGVGLGLGSSSVREGAPEHAPAP
jgi:excisionase family DNA binding protein